MQLNKERFLRTEFGSCLKECITAWDRALNMRRKSPRYSEEYIHYEQIAWYCQIQWEIYQMALYQFYDIRYCFGRTDEFFGVCTEDEKDWLFRVERNEERG